MDIVRAKAAVIDAGQKLLEAGLIARTWGNISCRINDSKFVITPSGRSYESLTPDEIVVVNIADCAYEGDIKPSSEKGIHADCYRLRPDVNFVIHTHQLNASVLSVLSRDLLIQGIDNIDKLGRTVACAAYGLPGTKKLRKNVSSAIISSPSKAVIMAHHGALCMGESFHEAFDIALRLEDICEDRFCSTANTFREPYNKPAYSSERKGDRFTVFSADGESQTLSLSGKSDSEEPHEADIHREIYNSHPEFNNIIHCVEPYTVAVSGTGYAIKPLLDDFAQLVGATLNCSTPNPKEIAHKLKGRNAVLVKNRGAFCCAGKRSDAEAVNIIVEKGCKTQIEAFLLGSPKPISPVETRLMRLIYLKKYSKKADK